MLVNADIAWLRPSVTFCRSWGGAPKPMTKGETLRATSWIALCTWPTPSEALWTAFASVELLQKIFTLSVKSTRERVDNVLRRERVCEAVHVNECLEKIAGNFSTVQVAFETGNFSWNEGGCNNTQHFNEQPTTPWCLLRTGLGGHYPGNSQNSEAWVECARKHIEYLRVGHWFELKIV